MSNAKDFSCIGGLEKHIRIVKETVLFPLMYGDIYAKFNLKPPRGLLFYGPPGTGKTLVASALAAECSNTERKVSFISRKGSDCLSKWVGESEKKLQKIFSLAQQSKPCIIFFDEVDGLAPVRTSRQDFVHASIVSTLLALMDGLENNSEIIVIGATNRIDAIDPALRRPGRFDRELYFPLPCYSARKEILSVHIKSWKQKPPQKFLAYLASKTVGFCGSDLQALCAEAVMCCVRRNYPEIFTSKAKYQINERHLKWAIVARCFYEWRSEATIMVIVSRCGKINRITLFYVFANHPCLPVILRYRQTWGRLACCPRVQIDKQDFLTAQQNIVPASHRVSIVPIKSLSFKIQPLLQDNFSRIMSQLETLCPTGMLICDIITGQAASRSNNSPRILLCGDDDSHTRHLGPALLHTLEHLPCHVLDVTTLFEETGRATEESIIQKMKMARRSLPSMLYIPDILAWWDLVDEAARVVFTSLMQGLDRSVYMLILTTANCSREDLPADIASLFEAYQGEVFEVVPPAEKERESFFKQLFVHSVSDTESNRSSQEDLVPVANTKKIKEVARRRKQAGRTDNGESSAAQEVPCTRRSRFKARNKVCTVRSVQAMTMSKTKVNVKRRNSPVDDGPPSKRTRNSPANNMSVSSKEKLNDSETEDLLQKIVEMTHMWPSRDLESIYASLELTLERTEEDICSATIECLEQFKQLRRMKLLVKKEEVED